MPTTSRQSATEPKNISRPQDHTWDYKDLRSLLLANIGYEFGESPEQHMDGIRKARTMIGAVISRAMEFGPDDTVADLGSGCGFVASGTAPHVGKLYCLDISEDFLDRCREELSSFSNVEYHLMPFADLSSLKGAGVNKIYAHAVFIHFNV